VLEGSTLGGRVIAGQLGPRLGLDPAHGLRFFLCYGSDADARWAEFGAALEHCAPEAERVAASALAVFAAIEAVLDAHESEAHGG
jgi:heme oxygenase